MAPCCSSLVYKHLRWCEGSEPGCWNFPLCQKARWSRWSRWRPLWTRAHQQGADPSADTPGPGATLRMGCGSDPGRKHPAGLPRDESLGTGLRPLRTGFQHPGHNPSGRSRSPSSAPVCQSMLSCVQSRRETNVSRHIKAGGSAGLYWPGYKNPAWPRHPSLATCFQSYCGTWIFKKRD